MSGETAEDIASWLNSEEKDDNVSKELFSNENIKTRTEVSDDELKAIAKVNFLCEYLEIENFPNMIDEFLELRVSHKRKSRGEFIKSLTHRFQEGMGGMFNRGGGNGGFQ